MLGNQSTQFITLQTDTTRLIYAYGEADPTGNELSAKDKHELANRGSKSIYLLEVPEATGAVPDDAMTHDFLSDQVSQILIISY